MNLFCPQCQQQFEAETYVPGAMFCPTCNVELMQMNLFCEQCQQYYYAESFVPGMVCPVCNHPLSDLTAAVEVAAPVVEEAAPAEVAVEVAAPVVEEAAPAEVALEVAAPVLEEAAPAEVAVEVAAPVMEEAAPAEVALENEAVGQKPDFAMPSFDFGVANDSTSNSSFESTVASGSDVGLPSFPDFSLPKIPGIDDEPKAEVAEAEPAVEVSEVAAAPEVKEENLVPPQLPPPMPRRQTATAAVVVAPPAAESSLANQLGLPEIQTEKKEKHVELAVEEPVEEVETTPAKKGKGGLIAAVALVVVAGVGLLLPQVDSDLGYFGYKKIAPMIGIQVEKPKVEEKPDPKQQAIETYKRGVELFQQESFLGAIEQFKKALEFDGSIGRIYRDLAIAYAKTDKKDESVAAYRLYLEKEPTADDAPDVKKIIDEYDAQLKKAEEEKLAAEKKAEEERLAEEKKKAEEEALAAKKAAAKKGKKGKKGKGKGKKK